ncbi:MAG: NAD(P)/FAD-dependent oxidoreductase [Tomitella sp.]|nr:NAD(P)/FAD-dependent oxidoreductase [Tomitella sp.]
MTTPDNLRRPDREVDVAIVGGGPAGLSAATALGRSLRSVLVIDDDAPRNARASGAHNVLGHEGVPPDVLRSAGRREAESYGVQFARGRVESSGRGETPEGATHFDLTLDDGRHVRSRRLLLATGLVDELPAVPGVDEAWADGVLHCPYCHGWEVRGKRIGVLASGPMSVHQALLFRQLSDRVVFLSHEAEPPSSEDAETFAALGIRVVDGPVERVVTDGTAVRAVELARGDRIELDALAVAPRFSARTALYEELGGVVADHPMGVFIPVGDMCRTPVDGVWAAGNCGDLSAMIAVAAGQGVMAGAAINADLVQEEAVAARRLAVQA